MNRREDALALWTALPRRLYLDTSTLQTVHDFGRSIFDGEPFAAVGRATRVQGLEDQVDCLRMILEVNQRAQFEFVVSDANLNEVAARLEGRFMQWAIDVRTTWNAQSEGEVFGSSAEMLSEPRFGMISRKDRALLQEAIDLRCDAFLTMERRLPTAAKFVRREAAISILRPADLWDQLRPWAALYW